ncbi:MAG: hypothetical protein ACKVWV_16955 [Planctomycetota bacterium]
MKISIRFGTGLLALSAVATSCTTAAGHFAHGDRVYLVGVAGGG